MEWIDWIKLLLSIAVVVTSVATWVLHSSTLRQLGNGLTTNSLIGIGVVAVLALALSYESSRTTKLKKELATLSRHQSQQQDLIENLQRCVQTLASKVGGRANPTTREDGHAVL